MASGDPTSDNGEVVLLEAALVAGLLAVVLYGTIRLLTRAPARPAAAARAGRWQPAHYDVKGETRVVVQRVTDDGREVLDEHEIARIRVDDPEYDVKFLSAMSTARERRALFEAEETD